MMVRSIVIAVGLLLGSSTILAQAGQVASQAVDTLDATLDQPFVLKQFISPSSFSMELNGSVVDTTRYRLNSRLGQLWVDSLGLDDEIIVSYNYLPFSFQEAYFKRRINTANPDSIRLTGWMEETDTTQDPNEIFGETQLERSGSITRGFITGNNRDLTLESGLRLELGGEITDGVSVQAVLTDENTPIQPEGTTQRLNEFDRVFIQLKSQPGTATLGDYDLRLTGSTFAPFSRKLQGISLVGRVPAVAGGIVGESEVTVAGATTRGIFQSQQIVALDGVQGPYRLEGRSGERFIIVIANSETVYIDGIPLTRGETNDYVIDYASGEITFTSKQLIAEETRISIEFEYTTSQFTRTLLGSQARLNFLERDDGGPARIRFNTTWLREADSRSFSQELGFNASDSLALARAGDGLASSPGEELVLFDPEAAYVQYARVDTTINGVTRQIFVAITDTIGVREVFRLRFTRVASGTGEYSRVGRSVNGILFEYVGQGSGDYVPVKVLARPKSQQMVDFNAVIEPIRGVELYGEWGRSIIDQNLLSDLDDQDNGGDALQAGIRLKPKSILMGERRLGDLSFHLERRNTSRTFEAFDRIRPIEFGRRWNLIGPGAQPAPGASNGEDLLEAGATFELSERSKITADWGRLSLARIGIAADTTATGFSGNRLGAEVLIQEPGYPQLTYRLENIGSADTLLSENGNWFRQMGSIRQPFKEGRITPFVEFEQEDRKQRRFETGFSTDDSFSFVEVRPGVQVDFDKLKIESSLERREDRGSSEGVIRDRSTAWTATNRIEYRPSRAFYTDADIGYRLKNFTDYYRENLKEKDGESVAIRWNLRWNPWARAVGLSWFYEALTERTPLLQETYVQTGAEFGQYVWEDANENGIREIDEFIPERTPNEGNYSLTFVPSDTLEPVINVQARLRLLLEPSRLWSQKDVTGFRKLLSNVTSSTTIDVLEKSKEEQLSDIYLLKLNNFRKEGTTVNGRFRFDQKLEFFKPEPRYGLIFQFTQLQSLNRLAAGTNGRFVETLKLDAKYRLRTTVSARLVASLNQNNSSSRDEASNTLSDSRTYNIRSANLEPELTVTVVPGVTVKSGFEYSSKADERPGEEPRSASVLKTPIEIRFARARKLQIVARAERASVGLDGDAIGQAAYELTDGRGPGVSYLWNISGNYRFSNSVTATLYYDGRAPSDAPVINTVRMNFSLTF